MLLDECKTFLDPVGLPTQNELIHLPLQAKKVPPFDAAALAEMLPSQERTRLSIMEERLFTHTGEDVPVKRLPESNLHKIHCEKLCLAGVIERCERPSTEPATVAFLIKEWKQKMDGETRSFYERLRFILWTERKNRSDKLWIERAKKENLLLSDNSGDKVPWRGMNLPSSTDIAEDMADLSRNVTNSTTALDLVSAFYQRTVPEWARDLFCFRVNCDDIPVYFRMVRLPMGCVLAPFIVQLYSTAAACGHDRRLLDETLYGTKTLQRQNGLTRVRVYIDNLKIQGPAPECKKWLHETLARANRCKVTLQREFVDVRDNYIFLGLFHLSDHLYAGPKTKRKLSILQEAAKNPPTVSGRLLDHVWGALLWSGCALRVNWASHYDIVQMVRRALALYRRTGKIDHRQLNWEKLQSLIATVLRGQRIIHARKPTLVRTLVLHTDASSKGRGTFLTLPDNGRLHTFGERFDEDTRCEHINVKEGIALLRGVKEAWVIGDVWLGGELTRRPEGFHLSIGCDSQAVVYCLRKRFSRSPRLAAVIAECVSELQLWPSWEIHYIASEENRADKPSREC